MFLAEQLGKFHWEVQSIPADEFDRWVVYFKIKYETQKKGQKKGSSEPPKPLRKKGG